jgi:hypothetical protein
MHVGLHEKCPLLLSDFKEDRKMSADFIITPQYKII